MLSAFRLTFSILAVPLPLPVGYSCSSSFPTLDGSVFPRSSHLIASLLAGTVGIWYSSFSFQGTLPFSKSSYRTFVCGVLYLFCSRLLRFSASLGYVLWAKFSKIRRKTSLTETWPEVDKYFLKRIFKELKKDRNTKLYWYRLELIVWNTDLLLPTWLACY